MINIGLYYKVKPGMESEFESKFNAAVSAIKKAGFGCIDARLYKEVSSQNEYLLYTEWNDMDGFKQFIKSEAYKETVAAGRAIIEGMPQHRIFTEAKH
ncbi:MAG: antibiotic biosynthesis monooxygenase [Candidatus Parvarchaeota archaeon]|jgi:Uncharacterized enzyme involved in biosynthesis of extracellular polysaccharides|nr:antibiotic biosynthesis monooxygenase [Candidatus Parvarchaeota archaeon]MCL5101275.1 antibiotic biosynthesis monooxygenase [Candidatus Parvarchaeota archaeon]